MPKISKSALNSKALRKIDSNIYKYLLVLSLVFNVIFAFALSQSSFVIDKYRMQSFISRYNSTPSPTIVPTAIPEVRDYLADKVDCIGGQVEMRMTEEFLVGKTFSNHGMSGEWGVFNRDHRFPNHWGLDYAGPDDDRPSSGVGEWSLEDSRDDVDVKVLLSRTVFSDGEYSGFRFFKYNGSVFALPADALYVIGESEALNTAFYHDRIDECF